MRVEVVYALPERADSVALELPSGATAADAVRASGIAAPRDYRLGIFGRVVAPDTRLRDGDRVEVYRPLLVEPKEARRRRARLKSSTG
jgi:putative ubiquitin-RnfH superfamily antitoxin RatB of RatAB toxin-antitoxin module